MGVGVLRARVCAACGAWVCGVRCVGEWRVARGCVGAGVCMCVWARAGVCACARVGVGVGLGVGSCIFFHLWIFFCALVYIFEVLVYIFKVLVFSFSF